MRKSRYSDEQIAAALRQVELGTPVAELTRKLGISEATSYVWKKRFGKLGVPALAQLAFQQREAHTSIADAPSCEWRNANWKAEPLLQRLGRAVAAARAEAGLTQEEVAAETG